MTLSLLSLFTPTKTTNLSTSNAQNNTQDKVILNNKLDKNSDIGIAGFLEIINSNLQLKKPNLQNKPINSLNNLEKKTPPPFKINSELFNINANINNKNLSIKRPIIKIAKTNHLEVAIVAIVKKNKTDNSEQKTPALTKEFKLNKLNISNNNIENITQNIQQKPISKSQTEINQQAEITQKADGVEIILIEDGQKKKSLNSHANKILDNPANKLLENKVNTQNVNTIIKENLTQKVNNKIKQELGVTKKDDSLKTDNNIATQITTSNTDLRLEQTSSPQHFAIKYTPEQQFSAQNQIGIYVRQAMKDGMNNIRVRLNPPELGIVDISMNITKEKHTKVNIIAEKIETLEMLAKDIKSLQNTLANAGIKADLSNINFSLQHDNQNHQNDDEQNNSFANSANNIVTENEEYKPQAKYRNINSILDLEV